MRNTIVFAIFFAVIAASLTACEKTEEQKKAEAQQERINSANAAVDRAMSNYTPVGSSPKQP